MWFVRVQEPCIVDDWCGRERLRAGQELLHRGLLEVAFLGDEPVQRAQQCIHIAERSSNRALFTDILRPLHVTTLGVAGTTEYGNNAIRMAPAMRAPYGEEGSVHKSALGFAIGAVLLSIPPAFAQSILEFAAGVRFCSTVKDDGQRLKCYDGLSQYIAMPSTVTPGPETSPEWSIKESKSSVDGSPQIEATLIADKRLLVLRCREQKTEAVLDGVSMACVSRARAPSRKISVSESVKVPG